MGVRERFSNINGLVFVVVICFALSSWIDLYGVVVEFPVFVATLPEGWALPSLFGIIITSANVGPLVYAFSQLICKKIDPRKREVFTIYLIISTGTVACLLVAFLWDKTVFVFGRERSLVLMILIFFLSFVDSTSCVVYLPFMSQFPSEYMPGYVAGEELGGLIAGFVGLAQGATGDAICLNATEVIYNETTGENYTVPSVIITHNPPRFSVFVFFLFLCGIMILSMLSFTTLNFAPFCKKVIMEEAEKQKKGSIEKHEEKYMLGEQGGMALNVVNGKAEGSDVDRISYTGSNSNKRTYILLALVTYVSFVMYGIGPSIHSYATLPYGSLAYMLSLRLSTVVKPIAALSTFFLKTGSLVVIIILVLIGNICFGIEIYLAVMSPDPPLADHPAALPLVVIMFASMTTLYSFARTSLFTAIHVESGHFGLKWAGWTTLLGSCVDPDVQEGSRQKIAGKLGRGCSQNWVACRRSFARECES